MTGVDAGVQERDDRGAGGRQRAVDLVPPDEGQGPLRGVLGVGRGGLGGADRVGIDPRDVAVGAENRERVRPVGHPDDVHAEDGDRVEQLGSRRRDREDLGQGRRARGEGDDPVAGARRGRRRGGIRGRGRYGIGRGCRVRGHGGIRGERRFGRERGIRSERGIGRRRGRGVRGRRGGRRWIGWNRIDREGRDRLEQRCEQQRCLERRQEPAIPNPAAGGWTGHRSPRFPPSTALRRRRIHSIAPSAGSGSAPKERSRYQDHLGRRVRCCNVDRVRNDNDQRDKCE